jgi:hypothetical protein
MRGLQALLNIASLLLLSFFKVNAGKEIYVCEAENPAFIGKYVPGSQQADGVDVYSNENDMSFFRSNGFWYLGNLEPWPPETHYRCVEPEGCNFQGEIPPTNDEGKWRGNRKFNSEKPPVVSTSPCGHAIANEEL